MKKKKKKITVKNPTYQTDQPLSHPTSLSFMQPPALEWKKNKSVQVHEGRERGRSFEHGENQGYDCTERKRQAHQQSGKYN